MPSYFEKFLTKMTGALEIGTIVLLVSQIQRCADEGQGEHRAEDIHKSN